MAEPSNSQAPLWLIAVSAVFLAGMWLYAPRVLLVHQVKDAAAHSRPRGNLSDLYPRWLGARELLLHGRDPYSAEVTREIQMGFYGRPLDPSNPNDPKDQEAFAYPVYVVFCLAPTVQLPFETVRKSFFWMLASLTVVTVLLWLRVLHWNLALSGIACILCLTFGSLVVLQGLKLQQLTLLVAALLAIAIYLLATERTLGAGFILALATIKPQIVCGLLLWLALWTLGDWRRRYRWMVSFLASMAVLFGTAELVLPRWLPRFLQAVHEYRIYAEQAPIFTRLLPLQMSLAFEIAVAAGAIFLGWKNRRANAGTDTFAMVTCMMLAATLLTIPSYALYNQVLLLPALLLIVRDRQAIWTASVVTRLLAIAVLILLSWQWVSSTVLATLSFLLPPEVVQKGWTLPAWTALTLPVAVVALMLTIAHRGSFPDSRSPIPA